MCESSIYLRQSTLKIEIHTIALVILSIAETVSLVISVSQLFLISYLNKNPRHLQIYYIYKKIILAIKQIMKSLL